MNNLFFNRDLNRGCLVYMFSLRFSSSKFLINLRRQFRVRKMFSLTSAFVLVSRIIFNRSNGLMIKCLIACLMN